MSTPKRGVTIKIGVPERLSGFFVSDPDIYQATNRFWFLLGCVAMLSYAFFTLQHPMLEIASHNLLVFATLVSLGKAPRSARTDLVVWFFAGAIVLGLFNYVQTRIFIPEYAAPELHLNKLLAVFLFFAIAWWLGGQLQRVLLMLAVALAGFVVALVIHGTWADLDLAVRGVRVSFGFHNAQHTAVFFSVALIGWSAFVVRFVQAFGPRFWLVGWAVWGTIFLTLLAGVVVTQTRAAWLGLAAAVIVAVLFILFTSPTSISVKRVSLAALVIAIVGSFLMTSVIKTTIATRLTYERELVEQVAHLDIDQLPETSVGIRISLWREGLRWFSERPWTGWGYTIRSRFIKESERLTPNIKAKMGHAHSSYIEILLVYGILGAALFIGLILHFAMRVNQAWRIGLLPLDVMLLGVCFFTFWAIVNVFESYVFGKTGTYLLAIVAGAVYTFPLAVGQRPQSASG